jgi:hypothetical protein
LKPVASTLVFRRSAGDAVLQPQLGKQHLLDHVASRIAQLRLQRHGGFLVQPEAVPIAELIARLHQDQLRVAAQDFLLGPCLDAVVQLQLFAVARQGG